MENDPDPDFEMKFYSDGTKVNFSLARSELIIKVPLSESSNDCRTDTVKFNSIYPDQEQLSASQQLLVKHAQDCLKQCMEVESAAKADRNAKYPIILKSSNCKNDSPGRTRSSSPTPSIHPSVISSYSVLSCSNRRSELSRKSTTGILAL